MIKLGTALKSNAEPYHRHVVISDPERSEGYVVLVAITTHRANSRDIECILCPAEWNELTHVSTVAFSTCRFGFYCQALEKAIVEQKFRIIATPPASTLQRIIRSALDSSEVPPVAKRYLTII